VIPLLKERGVDWKKALVAWKFKLAGEEQIAARYQYQDALAEAWGRTLYGGLTQWCEAKGVQSIGHFLEHRLEYLNPNLCAGNMFQLEKYSSMGGIDAVFAQFVMGKREGGDPPTWQTPKLGSSISHAYGKKNDVAMVEIFGARGQDLTYPEMKWWTDHMHVSGINFHIPHSFNPRGPFDTDCPPYFYNGGMNPAGRSTVCTRTTLRASACSSRGTSRGSRRVPLPGQQCPCRQIHPPGTDDRRASGLPPRLRLDSVRGSRKRHED
jgi:hypothetical protein